MCGIAGFLAKGADGLQSPILKFLPPAAARRPIPARRYLAAAAAIALKQGGDGVGRRSQGGRQVLLVGRLALLLQRPAGFGDVVGEAVDLLQRNGVGVCFEAEEGVVYCAASASASRRAASA